MGWDSPVKEVVNPAFINLESRNGLGWLEGFNEMMVRCGYEWTGHPVTADGQIYTLHGKAGNTPASLWWRWRWPTARRMKSASAGW